MRGALQRGFRWVWPCNATCQSNHGQYTRKFSSRTPNQISYLGELIQKANKSLAHRNRRLAANEVPGAGWGLFTELSIPRGEIVFSEAPWASAASRGPDGKKTCCDQCGVSFVKLDDISKRPSPDVKEASTILARTFGTPERLQSGPMSFCSTSCLEKGSSQIAANASMNSFDQLLFSVFSKTLRSYNANKRNSIQSLLAPVMNLAAPQFDLDSKSWRYLESPQWRAIYEALMNSDLITVVPTYDIFVEICIRMKLNYLNAHSVSPMLSWIIIDGTARPEWNTDVVGVLSRAINSVLAEPDAMAAISTLSHASIAGIYPLSALINHSCEPNMVPTFQNNNQMTWMSTRDIYQGEELRISYTDTEAPLVKRTRDLQQRHHFVCKCPRCLKESTQ